jgi:4-hydroxybenzoate polyprenyltransferase
MEEDANRQAHGLRQLGWLNWAMGAVFAVVAILPGIAHEDLQLPGWTLATSVFALAVFTAFKTLRVRR